MIYIISPETLKEWMEEDNVTIIDVRADLFDDNFGKNAYLEDHIPGAVFLDLANDLSGEVGKHGGNHPLPNVRAFAKKLGDIGISNHHRVVVYDDYANMFAPRAWFLMQYVGHKRVYVLEGGYHGWKHAGFTVTSEIPKVKAQTFIPEINDNLIVTMEEVKHRADDVILIDSRSRKRYLGIEEPLYKRAGHIPGAVNYFWEDVLREDGKWKSDEQLHKHFSKLNKQDSIIVSCGSGVSACANILALRRLGYENVKLYPGSFSDWISYEENEIETIDRQTEN